MTNILMEEMTFPLDHGCKLHVLHKYIGEDEAFICTLYDAADEVILMPDHNFGDVEHITQAYSSIGVAEAIHDADRCVARLNKEKVRKLLADGIDHLTQAM